MLEQFPFKILISQGLQVQLHCISPTGWTAGLQAYLPYSISQLGQVQHPYALL